MAYDEQKQAYQLAYIIRYLIFCAEKKDFLQYDDMRKIFGVLGEQVGEYAGKIGDKCVKEFKIPPLNALIVNCSGSVGDGWKAWAKVAYKDITPPKGKKYPPTWEEAVNECFETYHIPQGNDRFKPYNDISIPVLLP